MSKAEEAISS